MREALVIAITRMGDLVQSEPFCRALKLAGADKVTMLTEGAFVPVAEMLEGVDEVVSLHFSDIFPQLGRAAKDYPIATLNSLVESLRERSFTQVWNLTHTRPSMMLAAAVGGETAMGVTMDSQGRQVVRGEWLRYFFATNLARPWSVFNLVDVYVNSAPCRVPFEARAPRLNEKYRKRVAPTELRDMKVAIHPGASQCDKQWPVGKFQCVAQSLLERGVKVLLIGGKGDRELGKQFVPHPLLINRIGETPIHELAELLTDVDILISADSGPVHIAAAVGTKVIAIEGGSAHGWETAPYGAGHFVLQPHMPDLMSRVPDKKSASASASAITVESVLSVIDVVFNERQHPIADAGCTIYETEADDDTLRLNAQAGAHEQIDKWYSALRMMWSNVMKLDKTVATQESSAMRCASVARQLSQVVLSDHHRLERLAAQLQEEQKRLMSDLLKYPPLHALARHLEISLAAVEGTTMNRQARESAEVFEQIARGLDLILRAECTEGFTTKHSNMREAPCASI